jgi:hypothetical protein
MNYTPICAGNCFACPKTGWQGKLTGQLSESFRLEYASNESLDWRSSAGAGVVMPG